jgi:DNA replication ATP-dependent helicase Dna2
MTVCIGYIGKDSKVMQVVGATCLATQHPLLQNRTFDYCIVDEASQLTLPVCIGPLMYSKVFVLVGDLYQLPPLVKNTEARGRGLADSLFKRLSEAHPSAMQKLQFQYRMNREIMTLSNHLVYSHRLRCGSDQIATVRFPLPHRS